MSSKEKVLQYVKYALEDSFGPRGVGYPADARSVGDSHPSCFCFFNSVLWSVIICQLYPNLAIQKLMNFSVLYFSKCLTFIFHSVEF